MKGKKSDPNFLSQFIIDCVSMGKSSSEDMLEHAKKQIQDIDFKIKEVENLKPLRSKLLDVISVFEKTEETNLSKDCKLLLYFKIQNPEICKFVCDLVKDSPFKISKIVHSTFSEQDIIFCIKELLENKVLYKSNDHILRGEAYYDYIKNVFHII